MVRLNSTIRRELRHLCQASALGIASACTLYATSTLLGLTLSALALSGAVACIMLSALSAQTT